MRYAHPGTPGALVSFKSRYGNYIGGEFVAPVKGQYFTNTSPVNGLPIAEFPRSSAEDIDTGMRLGCNHPIGPLALADMVGLDTLLAVMEVLYSNFNDSKYRPAPLLVKYVEAGWLGRKSGRGFYDYSGAAPVPTR